MTKAEMGSKQKAAKLSPKEEKFCRLYVRYMNGAKAARMAKYSEKSARQIASRLLTKDYIKNRIEEIRKQVDDTEEKDIADAVEIQEILTMIIRGRATEEWQTKKKNGEECEVSVTNGSARIKDRLKAVELLAKMKGLMKDENSAISEIMPNINENEIVQIYLPDNER